MDKYGLDNRSFLVNLGSKFSQPGSVSCDVPQGSISGPPLFLIYVNDMSQAVKCHLFLYADDSCLVLISINEIEKQLNVDFCNICDWFVDNKLSIHFGEDQAKYILVASKFKMKIIEKLNIKYGDIQIKPHSKVKYPGCLMDETMPGEARELNVIHKINNKLKFISVKMLFLTPKLRLRLWNALSQPHFHYTCLAWYANLMAFKYFNEQCPSYLNEVFDLAAKSNFQLRSSFQKLKCPFRKTNNGQYTLSYQIPHTLKCSNSLNTFKHNLKKKNS